MDPRQRLHELIYVSILAPNTDAKGVAAIANTARIANRVLEITGVLVFDGERFCQFLEGRIQHVLKLFERISMDVRHANVDMLHQGKIEQRHFQRFSMGYAYVEDMDVIGTVSMQSGADARKSFVNLSAHIDFGL